MLQINKPQVISVAERAAPEPELISPRQLYTAIEGFLRRQHPLIAFLLLLSVGLGAVYLMTTPPKYTSQTTLVIDPHKTALFRLQSPIGDLPMDSATVDTQIEILRSEGVMLSVVKGMRLNEDPEFSRPRPGFVATIIGRVTTLLWAPFSSGSEPQSDAQLVGAALGTLQARLSVRRVGMTYAIEIGVQSFDPERAGQIANAVAEAYIVDSLEGKYETTRRAAVWLQDRLNE
jgi:succinoglycan biosynthesis transport protein ExoP